MHEPSDSINVCYCCLDLVRSPSRTLKARFFFFWKKRFVSCVSDIYHASFQWGQMRVSFAAAREPTADTPRPHSSLIEGSAREYQLGTARREQSARAARRGLALTCQRRSLLTALLPLSVFLFLSVTVCDITLSPKPNHCSVFCHRVRLASIATGRDSVTGVVLGISLACHADLNCPVVWM